MTGMVEDLLGFTRTQLGSPMPITLGAADVRTICAAAMEDAGATHPGTRFDMQASGDLAGLFDSVRLHQLITNLLVNAAQYGARDRPVVLAALREADDVVIHVTNQGPPIPEASWRSIFKPLIQLPAGEDDTRPRTSLGLSLFVARDRPGPRWIDRREIQRVGGDDLYRAASGGRRGRWTMKDVPAPSRDSTAIVPPWARTISRQM